MPAELTIRPATLHDVPHLVELATNTFRDTYRLLDDPDDIETYVAEAFTPDTFAAIVQDPASVLLVALCGEAQYVGYAHIAHSTPPPCVTGPAPIELSRLYLSESVIGKGYGAALMQAVHGVARRAGCKTVWLGVYDRNERARNFYTRWGFVDVGTKDFLFGGQLYADPIMAAAVPELVFESKRLRCRRWAASDFETLFAVYSDAEAMRWVGDGQPISREQCEEWFRVTEANYAKRGYGMFTLEDRASNKVVGFCGLVHPGGQTEAEVKYAFLRACWGQGLATEAVPALLAYAQATHGLARVIATVDPDNLASQRVLLKAGMVLSHVRAEDDGTRTHVYEWLGE